MSSGKPPTVPRRRRPMVFLALQGVVLAAFAAVGSRAARDAKRPCPLPPLREEPVVIRPQNDWPEVATEDQLRRAVLRLRLQPNGSRTMIPNIDHGLRFWGPAAEFPGTPCLSGEDLRRLLTDHRRFAELYGAAQPPLLIDQGGGVGVRLKEGVASCSHADHTVACLAEVGTPLSFPVVTSGRETTFRALVEHALRSFDLQQEEFEWSVKLHAQFLPPTKQWRRPDSQKLSFDRLAWRTLRDPLPRGVCWAQHRLFALAFLLRLDDETPLLSPPTRARMVQFLRDATAKLVAHQHAGGFWNDQWPEAAAEDAEPTKRDGDALGDRILVTGHTLEWWALAPRPLLPPRASVRKAAQWILRTLDGLSDEQVLENYAYLSHAVRGVTLWRGLEPADLLRQSPRETTAP